MKTEYSDKCDACKKRVEARIFFSPILNGDYPYLCKKCWEENVKKIEGDRWSQPTTETT